MIEKQDDVIIEVDEEESETDRDNVASASIIVGNKLTPPPGNM